MIKGCGLIVFDEEVGDPRQSVGDDEGEGDPPPDPCEDGRGQNGPAQQGTEAMHQARLAVAVGADILRPELGEACGGFHQSDPPRESVSLCVCGAREKAGGSTSAERILEP